jgi:hypothetical protein
MFDTTWQPPTTVWQIICWWEIRRLFYNAILFVIGFASLLAMEWFFDRFLPPEQEGIEPMALVFVVVVYVIAVNICYTSGWITELVLRRRNPDDSRAHAEKLFAAGMWLSCLLTTTPFWFGFISWLLHRRS